MTGSSVREAGKQNAAKPKPAETRKRKREAAQSQQTKSRAKLPQSAPVKPADADELALESLLFGADLANKTGVLPFEHSSKPSDQHSKTKKDKIEKPAFTIDTQGSQADNADEQDEDEDVELDSTANQQVWHDPDDEARMIDLSANGRMAKLKQHENEQTISATEFQQRLRSLYKNLNHAASWALQTKKQSSTSKFDELMATDVNVLRESEELPSGHLDIKAMRDANFVEPAQGVIHSVEFHPHTPLLMTAGMDATVRLFHIDGDHNPKIQSIRFPDMPIHCASIINDGREVFCTSRRKFFYSCDIETGVASRIPYVKGHETEKSWENHTANFTSNVIALLGNNGKLAMINAGSKQWMYDLKMNGSVRTASFSKDGLTLMSYGSDGDIYEWDLRQRRIRNRVHDYASHHGTCMTSSNTSQFLVTGGESGIVNFHTQSTLFGEISFDPSVGPEPLKVLDNLTHPVDHLTFNHSDELLCISSRRDKDRLRLFHVPSMTTVQNWPTTQTPLHFVTAQAFSPNGGFLAVGNDRGRVLLYRVKHYPHM